MDMYRKKIAWILALFLISVLIHIYSVSPDRVESQYATGIYPYISESLRFLFGWIPVSIGDILYGIAAVWLCWGLLSFLYRLIRGRLSINGLKKGLLTALIVLLSIYIIFNIFWGINYNRKGISYQLGIDEKKFTSMQLRQLDSILLEKVNESKRALVKNDAVKKTNKEIFDESMDAYKTIAVSYPFLTYRQQAVKHSLWGWVGNYLGFAGYYDPFTGEAQVNTTEPSFLLPYTTCHEMAHQLGYAKEDEANFVGYLAAAASTDTAFHYSVYLDLFLSANRNLYNVDSAEAKTLAKQLLPEVKTDLKEWRAFEIKHKNPVEPAIRWLYGKYLENNKQPSGLLTYDEVTGLLIQYYNKFGKM
jgi:hypothetical protein